MDRVAMTMGYKYIYWASPTLGMSIEIREAYTIYVGHQKNTWHLLRACSTYIRRPARVNGAGYEAITRMLNIRTIRIPIKITGIIFASTHSQPLPFKLPLGKGSGYAVRSIRGTCPQMGTHFSGHIHVYTARTGISISIVLVSVGRAKPHTNNHLFKHSR